MKNQLARCMSRQVFQQNHLLHVPVLLLITTLFACEWAPTPAKAGRIAFYIEGVGISVMNSDGSGLTLLTESGSAPVWSPDGRRLAFNWLSELYVIDADGSQRTRLTRDLKGEGRGSVDSLPSWFPDGRQIAVDSVYGHGTVYVVAADGSGAKKLITEIDARSPKLSPDGQRVAFLYLRQDRAGFGIAVADSNGAGWRALTENGNADCLRTVKGCPSDLDPVWSPDSQKIAFSFARDGEIYLIDAHGTRPLPRTLGPGSSPAWSPDGKQIALVSQRDGNREIYVVSADGASPRRLTQHPATDDSPAWSPDGQQIAFVSDRDGSKEIYLMSADGNAPVRLTNSRGNKVNPSWAPR